MSFATRCANIPSPGGGGCHPALLSAANAGVKEGLDDASIFEGIRYNIPPGGREVPDIEISNTIRTARSDGGQAPKSVNRAFQIPPAVHGEGLRELLAARSADHTGTQLRHMSKTQIPEDPARQFGSFVNCMYCQTDKLYVGPELSASAEHIYTARQLSSAAPPAHKFVINPLSGDLALKKDQLGTSYRCDNAVSAYRYMLIEMDGVPWQKQVQIWTTIVREELLPVAAVYYSGSKSIHALIRLTGCKTRQDWEDVVTCNFYPRIAVPLGADSQCRNPSRFSRVPGAQEEGRGVQWLLYLSAWQLGT